MAEVLNVPVKPEVPAKKVTVALFKLKSVVNNKTTTFVPDPPKVVNGKKVPVPTGRHMLLQSAVYRLVGVTGENDSVLIEGAECVLSGIKDQGWQPGEEVVIEISKA